MVKSNQPLSGIRFEGTVKTPGWSSTGTVPVLLAAGSANRLYSKTPVSKPPSQWKEKPSLLNSLPSPSKRPIWKEVVPAGTAISRSRSPLVKVLRPEPPMARKRPSVGSQEGRHRVPVAGTGNGAAATADSAAEPAELAGGLG